MECTTKFNDFISIISLTDSMKQELRTAYKDLKSKLNSNIISKDIIPYPPWKVPYLFSL